MSCTRSWVVVLALGLASGCVAHHNPLPPRPPLLAGKVVTYASGMRVIVEPDPGTKRVAVALLVGAGSAQDPVGHEGLAHFTEHLAFRSRPAKRLTAGEELDFAGVETNAVTGLESTTFTGIMPADRAGQVLPLMASLVTQPLQGIDEPAFEVERNVVRAERYDSDPHSGGVVGAAVLASVLPAGSRRPTTDVSLGAITGDDVATYVRAQYQPSNTIVVLTGDITAEAVEPLLRASFPPAWLTATASAPRRPGGLDSRVPDPPESTERTIIEARVEHRRLLVSWAIPGVGHPAGSAMPLVRRAVAQSLRRPEGVRWVRATLWQDASVGLLTIEAELDDDARPDEVRDALRKGGFGAFSFAAWQELNLVQIAHEQDLFSRAEYRAQSLFATGRSEARGRPPDQESLKALHAFEATVLTWARAREVLIMPFVRRSPVDEPPMPSVRKPPRELQVDAAAIDAVAVGPTAGQTRQLTLDNGLKVVLTRRPSVPIVSVSLALPGRSLHTSLEVQLFLSYLLNWERDSYVPNIRIGPDATVLSLSSLSIYLPKMLDALGNNLSPSVNRYADWAANDAAVKLKEHQPDDADDEGATKLRAPHGGSALVDQVMPARSATHSVKFDGLRSDLGRGEFVDFVDLAWRPDGAWLVIDGDLDLDPTEWLVHELFDGWSRGGPLPPAAALGAAPDRPKKPRVIENQDSAVTHIQFACRLPAGQTPEALGGVALLQHALQTTFEDELREELGLTYGVKVATTRLVHQDNLLWLDLTLNPANKQAALRRFLTKLEELDGAVWDERRVGIARWHVAKERLQRGLGSSSITTELAELGAAGMLSTVVLDWPRVFAKAPLRSVDEAWAACNDTYAMEIEGERSSIESALHDVKKP